MNSTSEIKAFQKKHGLVPDGIIGPMTRKVIAELNKPASASSRKEPDKSAFLTYLVVLKSAKTMPSISGVNPIGIPFTSRLINEIIVHCAATPEGKWFDHNDINAWHKQRGWLMGGYHFVILIDGTIKILRPIGMVGAHCEGHNTGTVGIAYIGGLTADGKSPKDTRTPAQKASLAWLVKKLKSTYGIKKRATGHNEYAQKACPSFNVASDFLGRI